MIVTLTLNPSVDRTVEVETLARGEVTRALGGRVDPGGKGINVSRALAAHGLPTRAVVTVGGAEGEHLVTLLRDTGIEIVPVRIRGAIRSNITIVEPDGTTTKINEPGAELSADELNAVFDAVRAAVESADWLVASGSLPPGTPAERLRRPRPIAGRIGDAASRSTPAARPSRRSSPAGPTPGQAEPRRARRGDRPCDWRRSPTSSRPPAGCATAGPARCSRVSAPTVPCSSTTTAPSTVGRRRSSPLSSVGAGDAMLAGFLAGGGDGRRRAGRGARLGCGRRAPAGLRHAVAATTSTAPPSGSSATAIARAGTCSPCRPDAALSGIGERPIG